MGLNTLRSLLDEQYYDGLDGGILECLGRLFKAQLALFIYPFKNRRNGKVEDIDDLILENSVHHLLCYLKDRERIIPLKDISHQYLDIHSPDVLALIASGGEWTKLVPDSVAAAIVQNNLFGYTS